MADTVVFVDANTLASPVTRTLVIAGARADSLLVTWSAHVEAEADRHARGTSTPVSVVRRDILGMELSKPAHTTKRLLTTTTEDRQVMADAIQSGARYLVTTDVDDFALEDLEANEMSAVNPDYFMALRLSEHAYREGVRILAKAAKKPPRSNAEVHAMLGRRHPNLTTRFAEAFDSTPVKPDQDQPAVLFRGAICVHCEAKLNNPASLRLGLCADHLHIGQRL